MAKHNECSRFSALYSLASDSSTTLSLLSKSDKILSTNLTQIIPYQVYKNSISLWYHILNTGPKDWVCLAMDPIYVACILWKVTAQPESGQLMLWGGLGGRLDPTRAEWLVVHKFQGFGNLWRVPLKKVDGFRPVQGKIRSFLNLRYAHGLAHGANTFSEGLVGSSNKSQSIAGKAWWRFFLVLCYFLLG